MDEEERCTCLERCHGSQNTLCPGVSGSSRFLCTSGSLQTGVRCLLSLLSPKGLDSCCMPIRCVYEGWEHYDRTL